MVPDSVPDGCRDATWGDLGLLLVISLCVQVLVLWKSVALRWTMIAMLVLIAVMVAFIALLDWRFAVGVSIVMIVGATALTLFLVLLLTVFRLADKRRVVVLTDDSQVCVDAVFRTGRSLSLRNHGRAFGATSAEAMREAVKEWIRPMIGEDFVISAQNDRVARMYMDQFPELQVIGRDWMGHPKLAVVPVGAAT